MSNERTSLPTWLLLLASLGAAIWLALHPRSHAAPARVAELELLGVVPAGPELLVTVEAQALDANMARDLVRAGGGALLGLDELCGFEPLLGLKRGALAVPRATPGERGRDFALIAQTSLTQQQVLGCAEKVLRKRGGKPVRSSWGGFLTVHDQGRPEGEVAMRADGLFVLSGGRYLREVIETAGGARQADERARLSSAIHRALRGKLGRSQLQLSMLSMPMLPQVEALGLGIELGRRLTLRAVLACPPSGCDATQELVKLALADAAKQPGFGSLANAAITTQASELRIEAELPREQLGPLVSYLLD
jgi:hypothetical protein